MEVTILLCGLDLWGEGGEERGGRSFKDEMILSPCSDEEGDSFVESPEGEKATAATTKKKERQIKSKRSTDIKIDTKFIWSGPVQESAFLTGSFSDWGEHVQLEKSGEVYSTTLPLAPGLYTFKYIIDGKWTHDG